MSSNTTFYDPTDDTVDTVATGLLPVLLVGLYKGFEKEKKKPFSFINVFDDFVIFASIVIFPFITGFKWYPYYSELNKNFFIGLYTLLTIGGLVLYTVYYQRYNDSAKDSRKQQNVPLQLIHIISNVLIVSSFYGYYMIISGDVSPNGSTVSNFIYYTFEHISKYCEENFTYEKCYDLRISNYAIYGTCIGVNIVGFCFRLLRRCLLARSNKLHGFKYEKLRKLGTISNHLVIITMIVYPAIASGWLLSTDSVTTKIAFGICSISLSRLVEHFGDDESEKVNTIISRYLNQYRDFQSLAKKKKVKNIKTYTKEIKKLAKKIEEPIEEIRILTEEIEDPIVEIKELTKKIKEKIKKKNKGRDIEEKIKEIGERTEEIERKMKKIREKLIEGTEVENRTEELRERTEEELREETRIEMHDDHNGGDGGGGGGGGGGGEGN